MREADVVALGQALPNGLSSNGQDHPVRAERKIPRRILHDQERVASSGR